MGKTRDKGVMKKESQQARVRWKSADFFMPGVIGFKTSFDTPSWKKGWIGRVAQKENSK